MGVFGFGVLVVFGVVGFFVVFGVWGLGFRVFWVFGGGDELQDSGLQGLRLWRLEDFRI